MFKSVWRYTVFAQYLLIVTCTHWKQTKNKTKKNTATSGWNAVVWEGQKKTATVHTQISHSTGRTNTDPYRREKVGGVLECCQGGKRSWRQNVFKKKNAMLILSLKIDWISFSPASLPPKQLLFTRAPWFDCQLFYSISDICYLRKKKKRAKRIP